MKNKHFHKSIKGFTLIELMIVVAIIGILAAIAYPSYQGYAERTNRKAAIAEMLDIGQQLERQYTINNGTFTGAAPTINTVKGYNIAAPTIAANGQSYTITATQGSGGDPNCGNLTITSDGGRSSTGSGSNCFR